MVRPDYREALRQTGVLETLAGFDPHVAGTPPLGLDLPGSDIDILCCAPDLHRFAAVATAAFGAQSDFGLRRWREGEAVIARFTAYGWPFEIFAQAMTVAEQHGWRHFRVEQRLLALGRPSLRAAVMAARRAGAKTEPAFAAVLGLSGDPYAALLGLEDEDDSALLRLLRGAGHHL